MQKYIAQHRIEGLQPPTRDARGAWQPHVVALGEVVEIEEEKAAPLVACGALKPYTRAALREAKP